MIEMVTGFIISFIITLFLLPVLIRFAVNRKIFVIRHFRSVHNNNVSSLGGVAIFAGVIFSLLFFSDLPGFREIKYYMAAGSFVFLVGLRDDIQNVKPAGKLLGQIIASFIITVPGRMRIEIFNDVFPSTVMSYYFSVLFTIFIIVWIINAYNFFDGIDMQATMLAIVIMIPSAIWFYKTNQFNFSLLLFATSAALMAFLFFNYYPSRIFMGDSGTVTIGFILAFSFIKFIYINDLPVLPVTRIGNPFVFGLLIMQLPLVDSVRVAVIRILRGRSPAVADKNHFHHLLLKTGWRQTAIAVFSTAYTLIVMILNYVLFTGNMTLYVILLINISLLFAVYLLIYRKLSMIKQGF